jgi:hypothetical protein
MSLEEPGPTIRSGALSDALRCFAGNTSQRSHAWKRGMADRGRIGELPHDFVANQPLLLHIILSTILSTSVWICRCNESEAIVVSNLLTRSVQREGMKNGVKKGHIPSFRYKPCLPTSFVPLKMAFEELATSLFST